MKYILIAIIAFASQQAMAHQQPLICVKKHDRHINLCVQYDFSRHYHNHNTMVPIASNRQYSLQSPRYNHRLPHRHTHFNQHYNENKLERTLDNIIKIAIIKELLED
jgi:hypothetical protein